MVNRRLGFVAIGLLFILSIFQNFERVPGLKRIVELPLGLKASNLRMPANETLDPAMIEVGNLLFFDQRLSKGGVMSCATCHVPSRGYSTTGIPSGVAGNLLERTAPPATNRAFGTENNWLGQRTLESQSTAPITSAAEMGLTAAQLVSVVQSIPGYKERFDRLLASGRLNAPAISVGNIQLVMATFQRSLMTASSRVDLYEAGQTTALTAQEIAGRTLFNGKARCILCHNGSNYTNEGYHNIVSGCPRSGTCVHPTTTFEAGRYLVTKNVADIGKFKTASLRNIALHPPYFHSGIDTTLKVVVHGYNVASNLDQAIGQDPLLVNLGLNNDEEDQVVAFLNALTGKIPFNATLSQKGSSTSANLRENFLLSPDLFDVAYYRTNNPDLASATDSSLQNHWITSGLREGRAGTASFSVKEYLSIYPTVNAQFNDADKYLKAAQYYFDYGRAEGQVGRYVLLPNIFQSVEYRLLNSGAIGTASHSEAISHYLTTGLTKKLASRISPSGYFSVNGTYYYADGKRICRFSDVNTFNSSYGRTDGLGFARLSYISPNLKDAGTCQAGAGVPPVKLTPRLAFGGMYGYGNGRTFVNPVTGSMTCGAGYRSAQIFGTLNTDYPLFYCYKTLAAGEVPAYDFGGAYGYGYDGAALSKLKVYPNPMVGWDACPSGFNSVQTFGTSGVDYNLFYCIRPHVANSTVGVAQFDGAFGSGATDAGVRRFFANPLTGAESCPANSTVTKIFGTVNVDWGISICTR